MKYYVLAMTMAVVAATWTSPARANPRNAGDLCEKAVVTQEVAHRIPAKLLHAISLAETGRWDAGRKENYAWPWTVTSGGEGQYYPSKQTAIQAVRKLQRRGVRNIDVGCMQINLQYHPDAFRSLDEAFDPAANAAYAAEFLGKLRQDKRSWMAAVKHYHSATPELHGPYREKVYKIWRDEKQQARRKQIAEQRKQYAERRRQYDRGESVTQRILQMADRLDARGQLWLENAAAVMLRNSAR